MKLQKTGSNSKKRVVPANLNASTGMETRSALADNNFSTSYLLSIKKLHAKTFAYTIAAVLRRTTRFTRCHRNPLQNVCLAAKGNEPLKNGKLWTFQSATPEGDMY